MSAAPQKPTNFPEMINQIQTKIDSMGPGPHTEAQKEEIKNLQFLLAKAKQENSKTPHIQGTQPQFQMAAQPVGNGIKTEAPMLGASGGASNIPSTHKILDRKRLQDLVKEIDPNTQLEDDVEEVLMQIADDFIENVVNSSCDIAKHRCSDTLEVKDVQLHLERTWNMWIPGFGSEDIRPYKKAPATEAHKQRVALMKKMLRKA